MAKKKILKIHSMDDWFSGIYIKPFGAKSSTALAYDRADPHRHDFYYVVLLEEGQLEMTVDFAKVNLSSGMFFLYPGQVHQIDNAKTERGWFLAFNPDMLDERLKGILDQSISEIILFALDGERLQKLSAIADQIFSIHNETGHRFRKDITQSIVAAFIYEISAIYLSREQSRFDKYSVRKIEVTKKFMQILRHNYRTMKKPSEFALKLNITSTHLNDTVKDVTGFSVTYHIQKQVMREAQRLLFYSGYSVKEIAGMLGFDDEQYFNRLFSKVVGNPPGAFRKNGTNV